MPVSDNLVDIIVHLVVGLLGNKADEHKELLVVLLNPDVPHSLSSQNYPLPQTTLSILLSPDPL